MKAKRLVEVTQETLDEYADHLEGLEQKIREAQQRAFDQVTEERGFVFVFNFFLSFEKNHFSKN